MRDFRFAPTGRLLGSEGLLAIDVPKGNVFKVKMLDLFYIELSVG